MPSFSRIQIKCGIFATKFLLTFPDAAKTSNLIWLFVSMQCQNSPINLCVFHRIRHRTNVNVLNLAKFNYIFRNRFMTIIFSSIKMSFSGEKERVRERTQSLLCNMFMLLGLCRCFNTIPSLSLTPKRRQSDKQKK